MFEKIERKNYTKVEIEAQIETVLESEPKTREEEQFKSQELIRLRRELNDIKD